MAALGVLVAMALAAVLSRANRRGASSSAREIARAAEEIAEGRFDLVPVLTPGDPLRPAAEALGKVAASFRARLHETERRAKMAEEILASTREVAILLTDPQGDIRYANAAAENLFGWKSGGGAGRNLATLFESEEYETLVPLLARRNLRDERLLQRARLLGQGGDRFEASLSVTGCRSLPGGGEGLLFEIRDLSGEESLRSDLRDSEEMHRALIERIPMGVFVVQDDTIVFANTTLAGLLEVRGSPAGTPLRDWVTSEDLLRVIDLVRRCEKGMEPRFEIDCRLWTAGSRWPVEVSLDAAQTTFRGRPAVLGTVRPADSDREALRVARRSEARLDAALDGGDDAILLVGPAEAGGGVTYASRRFEDLLGVPPGELRGLSEKALAARLASRFSDAERVEKELAALLAGDREEGVHAFRERAPRGLAVLFSVRPARDREGRPIGRLLAVRDVTAQRESEHRFALESEELARTRESLEGANSELERLNGEINVRSVDLERVNQELRALDEMKSNLLANVSHELQTPLVSVKGYTEMILRGRLGTITDEQKKGLEVSLRNIDRLIGMIQNLLNFSRVERGMAGMKISTFPLHQVIEEAIDLVREVAEDRRILLTSRYLTEDLTVKADRDKISQVFINLLGNAVKYNREAGRVEVDVRRGKQGYLIVDVRDTGIGIPRESLEKVFDRDYRVAGAGTSAPGTGIGLAIVRDILRMHGCIIKADSRMGEGSVFTLTLPSPNSGREDSEESPRGDLLPGADTGPDAPRESRNPH